MTDGEEKKRRVEGLFSRPGSNLHGQNATVDVIRQSSWSAVSGDEEMTELNGNRRRRRKAGELALKEWHQLGPPVEEEKVRRRSSESVAGFRIRRVIYGETNITGR